VLTLFAALPANDQALILNLMRQLQPILAGPRARDPVQEKSPRKQEKSARNS